MGTYGAVTLAKVRLLAASNDNNPPVPLKASLSGASTVTLLVVLMALVSPDALMTVARSESWGVACTACSRVVLHCTIPHQGKLS